MKTLNIKFLATALFVLAAGVKSFAQISKAEIIATGLTCSMCSNAINKQLKSMSQVDSISTDLNTNTFTVYFKENTLLQPKVLKTAVEKAGFFVGSMVLTMKLDPQKIENNTTFKIEDGSFILMEATGQIPDKGAQYKILDKGFVTQKEYKKLAKSYSKHPSYTKEDENDYHLKAI